MGGIRLRLVRGGIVATILALPAAVAPAAAQASVAALWHMDETSGTVMHDSAGGHDGTIHNVTLGLAGFAGNAYGFDRSRKSNVSVPSADTLNPGSGDFTISLYFKGTVKPSSGDYDLVKKGDYTTAGGEFKVEALQNGQALCGFKGSQHNVEVTGGNLFTGGWRHIRCTKTSTQVILKVAGTSYTKTITVGPVSNTAPVSIGANAAGGDYTTASLDEVELIHGR